MNLLHRVAATAFITAALAGCKNMGLHDLKTHEAAMQGGVSALVQQVSAIEPAGALDVVQLGGHSWIESGRVYRIPQESLRPVGGSAGGVSFYRIAWDEAPYDRLFVSRPGGLVEYAAIY